MVVDTETQKIVLEWANNFNDFGDFLIFTKWEENIAITQTWKIIKLNKDYKVLFNYQKWCLIYSNNTFYSTKNDTERNFEHEIKEFICKPKWVRWWNQHTPDGVTNEFTYQTWDNYIIYFNKKTKGYEFAEIDTNVGLELCIDTMYVLADKIYSTSHPRFWIVTDKKIAIFDIQAKAIIRMNEYSHDKNIEIKVEVVEDKKWWKKVFLITPWKIRKETKKELKVYWTIMDFETYGDVHYISK